MSENEKNESDAESLKKQGTAAYKARDFKTALRLYNEASVLDPSNMVYSLNKGAVYLESEEYDTCVKECVQAVTLGDAHLTSLTDTSTSAPDISGNDQCTTEREHVCGMIFKAYTRMGKALLIQGMVSEAEIAFIKAAAAPRLGLPSTTRGTSLDDTSASREFNETGFTVSKNDGHVGRGTSTTDDGNTAVSSGQSIYGSSIGNDGGDATVAALPAAGTRIELQGLSNAKYNGSPGIVTAVTADGVRLIVKLDSSGKEIRVKPCNTKVLTKVSAEQRQANEAVAACVPFSASIATVSASSHSILSDTTPATPTPTPTRISSSATTAVIPEPVVKNSSGDCSHCTVLKSNSDTNTCIGSLHRYREELGITPVAVYVAMLSAFRLGGLGADVVIVKGPDAALVGCRGSIVTPRSERTMGKVAVELISEGDYQGLEVYVRADHLLPAHQAPARLVGTPVIMTNGKDSGFLVGEPVRICGNKGTPYCGATAYVTDKPASIPGGAPGGYLNVLVSSTDFPAVKEVVVKHRNVEKIVLPTEGTTGGTTWSMAPTLAATNTRTGTTTPITIDPAVIAASLYRDKKRILNAMSHPQPTTQASRSNAPFKLQQQQHHQTLQQQHNYQIQGTSHLDQAQSLSTHHENFHQQQQQQQQQPKHYTNNDNSNNNNNNNNNNDNNRPDQHKLQDPNQQNHQMHKPQQQPRKQDLQNELQPFSAPHQHHHHQYEHPHPQLFTMSPLSGDLGDLDDDDMGDDITFEELLQQFKDEDAAKKLKKSGKKQAKGTSGAPPHQHQQQDITDWSPLNNEPSTATLAPPASSKSKKKRKRKKGPGVSINKDPGARNALATAASTTPSASNPTTPSNTGSDASLATSVSSVAATPNSANTTTAVVNGPTNVTTKNNTTPAASSLKVATSIERLHWRDCKDDASLGPKAKLIVSRCQDMELKEKGNKLSLQDIADYEIFVQGLVKSMENDKQQISRKYRMAEAKLKLARDPKRVAMLSDEIDNLKRRERRFNEDVSIVNQEVDYFHESPAFKMARAHVLENFVEQGGTWVNKKTLEEDVVDFEALLKEMKLEGMSSQPFQLQSTENI